MNGELIRCKGLIVVALGAGVMIGAAGVLLYSQYVLEKKRLLLQKELNELGLSIVSIRGELSTLKLFIERNLHMAQKNTRREVGAPSVTTEAETEMFSTVGGDDFYDEFYELSSDNGTAVEEAETSPYQQVDILLEGSSKEDKTKCYGLLLELVDKDNANDEVLWRLAKSCHMMSSVYGAEGNADKKKEFIYKGIEYAEVAIGLNDNNWKAHKWYAVCVGERGQLQGVKEKLQDGHLFKEHVDKALQINPEDALLHHLLGRFNYEVASLTWLERKVASTLFGDVPIGTFKNAIKSLLEAEKLHPTPWKANRLLLAKCYAALQDNQETLKWLDSAKEITVLGPEDQVADKEVDQFLKKFNSYRKL